MTEKILYIFNPSDNISPFDVTMAADAGFNHILPFTNVKPKNVTALIQDAIFARPPNHFNDTGIFIGGRDVHSATDMIYYAKKAMVGPFQVGVFADPNGAYTTSASIMALIQKSLLNEHQSQIKDQTLAIFGTGPVGLCTAILAAKQGATVRLCQLTAQDNKNFCMRFCERYKTPVEWVPAMTRNEKVEVLEDTTVIISAAKAGVRIIEQGVLAECQKLKVIADTNAVPPSGINGIGLEDANKLFQYNDTQHCHSIGALAIGQVKSSVELGLFKHIQTSKKPAWIDFPEAYEFANALVNP